MKRNFIAFRGRPVAGPLLFAVFAGLVLAAAGMVFPASAETRAVPDSDRQIRLSFAPIVRDVAPAVVNIYAKRVVREQAVSPFFDDPFFRRFFGEDNPFGRRRERLVNSLGSGVIVDGSGIVVTNHHVIKNADSIKIVLTDRREFDAQVLVTDERTDIAVLRVTVRGEKLPALRFGDSDALEVGDLVLAIGNPFGLGQTVSSGIVSGLARTSVGITDFRSFIQTDAAINPGNSGGALVAMDGTLVGINTAIYSRNGGSVGIGFAVPSSMVRSIVKSAIDGKPLVRPWLSLRGTDVTAEVASALETARPGGVLVESVHKGGPAAAAGLQPGDVIIGIGRHRIDGIQELRFRLATREIGKRVVLLVRRRSGTLQLRFELRAPPEMPPRNLTVLDGPHPLAGAEIVNLSPAVAEEMGIDDAAKGVLVTRVKRRSSAAQSGIRPGDRIVSINDRRIERVAGVKRATAKRRRRWELIIQRGGQRLRLIFG
jgi:serine protease Do